MTPAALPVLLDDEVAFDRDLHAYHDEGGARRMSVTQVLTIAGLVDYTRVLPSTLREAQQRGTLVHHAAAIIDRGEDLDEFEVPAGIEGYIEAYHMFQREMRFVPDLDWIERPMIVTLFGQRIGMTPDAVGTMAGVPTLIERKTCSTKHPAWALQTAGYCAGLKAAGLQIRQRIAVQLMRTGNYKLHPYDDPGDFEGFKMCHDFACLKLKLRLARLD